MATIVKRLSNTGTVNYQAKIRLRGHPPESATFERLTDAKKWAQDMESSMRQGRHFKTSAAKKHTVAAMIDRYLKQIASNRPKGYGDVKPKLDWWKEQIGYATLADVTKALIIEKRDLLVNTPTHHNTKRTPATVNRYMTCLSHTFTIAVNEWEWLEFHPFRKVGKLKEPRGIVRFLSDDERDRLLEACRQSTNEYLYLIVVLALSTGARRGEILNIQWQDVDLQRRAIVLHETKNKERRVLPLTGHALELMKTHEEGRHKISKYVFPSENGKAHIDIGTAWKNAIKRSGVADFRFHDLRHSAASYLAMNGASLAEIAEVLGHKTLQMVKRYAHLSEAHTSKVVARMNEKIFG